MKIEVKIPALAESVQDATLLEWHKGEGQYVERDENLVDLETDKVIFELPAPASGVLVQILQGNGAVVTSDQLIAVIDTEARASVATSAAPAAAPAEAAPSAASAVPPSPAAQKLIADGGLDAGGITGSGRHGQILKEDVLNAARESAKPEAPPAAPPVGAHVALAAERPEQRVPMTRLRARIAERLVQAQHEAAMLTTFNEVDMSAVMALRAKYRTQFEQEHGAKLGFMSFFAKAAVAALKKFPVINASIDGHDIVYHGYYDLGVAVSSPRGLVVPVIRDVDRLSFSDIEQELAKLGSEAQAGQLSIESLTGGTFTITNGGIFGSMMSTPILNPPQSAILGMHAIKERPVVVDGQIVARPMMYLALSYDHRIIDGREAVQFLVTIKEAIEDPARLLLNI